MATDGAVALTPGAAPKSRISPTAVGVIFAATFGCFVSVTPTIVTVMGVFLKSITAEFGWLRSEVAGALAVIALGNAIAYPFAGRLADRIGARRTALIGNLLLGISILAISQVPAQPAIYYLVFIFAGAAGALPSTMIYAKLIAEWFDRTRGLWMGFCGGIGNAVGAILFPSIGAMLLETHGWRTGFLGIGIFVLLVGFPVLFFLLRESPARQRKAEDPVVVLDGMTFREAMRKPLFWLIFSIVPLGAGCMTAMFTAIPAILTDRGLAMESAIQVISAFALSTLFVEPTVGWLTDRTTSPKIVAPLYMSSVIGLWLLIHAQSQPLLIVAGLLIGVGAGVEYTVLPYLLSRYFGLKEFGAISGIAYAGTLGFGALAPVVLNGVYDLTGKYDLAVYGIAGVLLYSATAILTFGPYRFTNRGNA
jgi:MFS family permease